MYIDFFTVDFAILAGPYSIAKLKSRKIHSAILTTAPHQSQAVAIYTWKPLILLSVVCASLIRIGRATAVYGVRASWVRKFAKLKPRNNLIFRTNPRNIVPTKNSTYTAYVFSFIMK